MKFWNREVGKDSLKKNSASGKRALTSALWWLLSVSYYLCVMFILSTQKPEANLLMLIQVKPLGVSLERASSSNCLLLRRANQTHPATSLISSLIKCSSDWPQEEENLYNLKLSQNQNNNIQQSVDGSFFLSSYFAICVKIQSRQKPSSLI